MARQIVVDIVGDASKFNQTVDGAANKSKGFGDTLGKALVAAGVVAGAAAIGGAIFGMGASMEALDVKAKTVFGDSLGIVDTWAKKSAAAMGLTSRQATGLAANFADLLIPMGFTRDAAAKMSTDVVGLSGALSEWSGGTVSAAEVSDILAKAMLGERDGLKALGISIMDADVKARLLKNGTSELTGAALEQAKAIATQQLIFEKSTDAQTAYADGTAVGIRQQHEMEAAFNTLKEAIVGGIYPAFGLVSDAIGFVTKHMDIFVPIVAGLGIVVLPALAGALYGAAAAGWAAVAPMLVAAAPFIAVGLAIAGVIYVLNKLGILKTIGDMISNVSQVVLPALGAAFRAVGTVVTAVFSSIGSIIRAAINGVIGIINHMIGAINAIQVHIHVGPVNLDWNGLKIGKIPTLHAGGIVPGIAGSDQLALLQAGERVIPRNEAANGGLTINFNGPVFGDDQFIDDFTRKIAMRLRTAG